MSEQERRFHAALDPEVDRAWREASDEQPAARVDAVIRAAAQAEAVSSSAHETARQPARSARRLSTWMPVAAAAGVAAIAFGLVQLLPREPAAPAVEDSTVFSGRDAPARSDAAAAAPAAPAAKAFEANREIAPPALPGDQVAKIRALLAQGDEEAAIAALQSLRKARPDTDALLPADLRAWAAGIRNP